MFMSTICLKDNACLAYVLLRIVGTSKHTLKLSCMFPFCVSPEIKPVGSSSPGKFSLSFESEIDEPENPRIQMR